MTKTIMQRFFFTAFVALILSSLPIPVRAQDASATKAEMNRIKSDEKYIYGEGTAVDLEKASAQAMSDLKSYMVEECATKNKTPLSDEQLSKCVKTLSLSETGRVSVLVYILASDLDNGGAVASTKPVVVPDPQPAPSPIEEKPTAVFISVPSSSGAESLSPRIARLNTWLEIKGIVAEAKHAGKISATGVCGSLEEVPTEAWTAVFDKDASLVRMYSPAVNGSRSQYRSDKSSETPKFFFWYK